MEGDEKGSEGDVSLGIRSDFGERGIGERGEKEKKGKH